MRTALLSWLAIAAATAQAQVGRIQGIVVDSASHQPVKKATVTLSTAETDVAHGPTQGDRAQTATTDSSGAFAFDGLAAGQYQLTVMHQNYPQARMGGVHKTVQVSAVENSPSVTVELVPGAAVTGHVVDEDGDPLSGCMVQVHSAKNFNQTERPGQIMPMAHEDGSYRLYGISPGKYTITAQCMASVFQLRPLSEGPDPSPSAAYPIQFYPAASDLKSAEILELLPGAEKSGVDFKMRPVPVTHIHGRLVAGSADWRGRSDLQIQLEPLDQRGGRGFATGGAQVNPKDGSFEIPKVFPGSYRLMAFSQNFSARGFQADASDRVGAIVRVDVADKPVEVSLQLHRAVDISGTVQIERGNNATDQIAPNQINIILTSENQFGGPPPMSQVDQDGSFTLKSVLPGEWRIRLDGPSVFVKSARLGNDDFTNRPLDLTSGSAAPLRIVVSTNTATIRGTAPAGQMVYSAPVDDDDPTVGFQLAPVVDSSGQFTLQGLAPGKYRVVVADIGAPMPEEGGQEVTVGEGETATIEIKPETTKP